VDSHLRDVASSQNVSQKQRHDYKNTELDKLYGSSGN
jgi:hypothetical protein